MKKVFIWLLILTILLPGVFASTSSTIHDGWIKYKDTITHDGQTYTIISSNVHLDEEKDGKLLIKHEDKRYIVYFNDCIIDELYEFCFVNRSFSEEGVDIDDKGNLQPAIKIKFTKSTLATTITKTKTFTQTTFLVDDTAEVTITLKNEGDIDITNIVVNEIVPSNFEIVKSDYKSKFADNEFSTILNLYSGSEWTTTYTIKAIRPEDVTYGTNITYDTVLKNGTTELFGSTNLKFDESHTIIEPTIKESYIREDKDKFILSLTNKETENLIITRLKMTVSPLTTVTNKKNLRETLIRTYYTDELVIEPGDTQTFELDVKFNVVGDNKLTYELEFKIRDEEYVYNKIYNTSTNLENLQCYFEVPEIVLAGHNILYEVFIENLAEETFYEIEGNYSSFDKQETFNIPNIYQKGKEKIGQGETLIPFSLKKQNFSLNISAKYRTVDKQYFYCDKQQELIATPAEKLLELKTKFKDESVQRNKTVNLTITLENLLDTRINETIEIYFHSKEGKAESVSINKLTTEKELNVEFFIYELVRSEIANITTTIKIQKLNNYTDKILTSIEISNPYTGNITIEKLEKNIIQELKEKETTKEKMNFVEKIISYFKNFFK